MALVVETGSGTDPTANSYISEADANAYLAQSNRNSGAWRDAGKTAREGLLVLAAQYMAARFNGKWIGTPANEDQPLDWPRLDAWKKSGHAFTSSEIPEEVKRAQVEYALIEATSAGSLFPTIEYDATNRPVVKVRQKVDVIEEERQFANGVGVQRWRVFPVADGLIRHLTSQGGHLSRV